MPRSFGGFTELVRRNAHGSSYGRGWGYFQTGRVEIVECDPQHVVARVRGSRDYTTRWEFAEPIAYGTCDCPYVTEYGDVCKHLVAVAIAFTRRLKPSVSLQGVRVQRPSSSFPVEKRPAQRARDAEIQSDRAERKRIVKELRALFEESGEKELSELVRKIAPPSPKKPEGRVLQLPSTKPEGNVWWRAWIESGSATPPTSLLPIENAPSHAFLVEVPGASDLPDTNPDSLEVTVVRATRVLRQDRTRGLPRRVARNAAFENGPGFESVGNVLSLLVGANRPEFMTRQHYSVRHIIRDWYTTAMNVPLHLRAETAPEMISRICATGVAFPSIGFKAQSEMPLRYDDGAPFTLAVEMSSPRGGSVTISIWLERGDERIAIESGLAFAAGGLGYRDHLWFRFESASLVSQLRSFVKRIAQGDEVTLPETEARAFIEALHRLPASPRLIVDPKLAPTELLGKCSVNLRLELDSQLAPSPTARAPAKIAEPKIVGRVLLDYGGREFAPGDRSDRILDAKNWSILRRDFDREHAALEIFRTLGIEIDQREGRVEIPAERFAEIVRTASEAGICVLASARRVVTPKRVAARVRSSGVDWFDLEMDVDFGSDAPGLPTLLAAVKRGERLVKLSNDTFGVIPEAWLRSRQNLLKIGEVNGQSIRFHRSQAMFLHAMTEGKDSGVKVEVDRAFQSIRTALARGGRPVAEDPCDGFHGTLRPYQREGLGWMNHLRRVGIGGCLADDMGLGKTVQVLALIAGMLKERSAKKRTTKSKSGNPAPWTVLVVAPRSLVFNWLDEAKRFVPELPTLAYIGTKRGEILNGFDSGLIVTTYGTLRADRELEKRHFSLVVLDEAQSIKNRDTVTARAARELRCDHRLALSGTPVENHSGELISLFEFLIPGLLGAHAGARTRDLADGNGEDLLFSALRPLMLRRTKEQVAPDLPKRTEQTILCELEGLQRERYDELRDHYRSEILEGFDDSEITNKQRFQVLEALLRLRQAACHPALIDPRLSKETSAKLDVLIPKLRDVVAEGHKALVFSQFTSFLALVRERLDAEGLAYEYLDGSTRDRAARVKHFQEDANVPIFLISLRAGGLGLNLTVADYVFLLDPWWNPAVEAQAIDRTHRIGQTKPVFAYRLLAKDTVEERVAELQARKRELFDSLMTETATLRDLDLEDLRRLLS